MTVDELIDRLQHASKYGCGDQPAMAWDPDSEQWEEVSGFTYSESTPLRLYTDDPS